LTEIPLHGWTTTTAPGGVTKLRRLAVRAYVAEAEDSAGPRPFHDEWCGAAEWGSQQQPRLCEALQGSAPSLVSQLAEATERQMYCVDAARLD
jgi:hypothetical protein